MLDDLHDCYRALDLEPGATLEEVKRSYRELVKVWHPDRFAGDPKLQRKAEEKLKQINFAYEWISKGEAAAPRRRTRSARPSSSGTGQQAKPPGSQAGPKEEQAREQSPPPKTDRGETASQQGKEPKWAHAAIGFGFLALSLWLMPTLWDDFSKYEAGEGIRTTRKMFLLYQLLGKQGVVACFLLFGLFMGYLGLCHARALLSGQQHIRFNLKKGHLITAAVALGFFVLIGDRPGRRTAGSAPAYTQQRPNYPAQVPPVAPPQPKVREALTIDQIAELHREALKRNSNLQMSVQEFSQYAQANQTEYDFSAGIAYSPPTEATKQTPIQNRLERDFFTIGSTKDEVLRVQGKPDESTDAYFSYGNSTVFFENGRVKSWTDLYPKMKVRVPDVAKPDPAPQVSQTPVLKFFTIGSTKDEVLSVQGKPDESTDAYFSYGNSTVFFENGRVKSWTDLYPKLKVRAPDVAKPDPAPPVSPSPDSMFFTIGSTKDEVLAIQGTPTRSTDAFFSYGNSTVFFENDRVRSWSDGEPKLKVRAADVTKLAPAPPISPSPDSMFFTIGSTKDEVLAIQGTPTRSTDAFFSYGNSTVFFENGRVRSWSDGEPKLKVRAADAEKPGPAPSVSKTAALKFFTVGSSREEVLATQGTPDEFTDTTFTYGYSRVHFRGERVSSWDQSSVSPLNAKLLPSAQTEARSYYTVGSSKDEVLAVQGTPDKFTDSTFTYGYSRVQFRKGQVVSWDQSSVSPLKARLLPATEVKTKGYFTVGSTKDEVLAIQGTPDQFSDATFTYGYSRVSFRSGRVASWNQSSVNPLKAKLLPATHVDAKGYFTVGSTKDEVLAVQGTPDEFSDTTFTYGYSRIHFQGDRVRSWDQSSVNPLKARLVATPK